MSFSVVLFVPTETGVRVGSVLELLLGEDVSGICVVAALMELLLPDVAGGGVMMDGLEVAAAAEVPLTSTAEGATVITETCAGRLFVTVDACG